VLIVNDYRSGEPAVTHNGLSIWPKEVDEIKKEAIKKDWLTLS